MFGYKTRIDKLEQTIEKLKLCLSGEHAVNMFSCSRQGVNCIHCGKWINFTEAKEKDYAYMGDSIFNNQGL